LSLLTNLSPTFSASGADVIPIAEYGEKYIEYEDEDEWKNEHLSSLRHRRSLILNRRKKKKKREKIKKREKEGKNCDREGLNFYSKISGTSFLATVS